MDKYDVFISYSSKDSRDYATKLVNEIQKLGIKTFYDMKDIDWGDNISEKINGGLLNSKIGLFIISKGFLNSNWTDYEVKEFMGHLDKEKTILPLLRGVTKAKLINKYPELGNIHFVHSKNYKIDQLAFKIKKILIKRK